MESFAHFRYFLSHAPNLPEGSLARELYLRDGQGQTTSERERDDGGGRVWIRNKSIVPQKEAAVIAERISKTI